MADDWWDQQIRTGFVFECDEFDDGSLTGCVGCGDDTWLNEEALCPDCWEDELEDQADQKLEDDARTLMGKSMGISLARDSLKKLPAKLVAAKAEHLRLRREIVARCRGVRGSNE